MRRRFPALVAASSLVVASSLAAGCAPTRAAVIGGPFAALLADSTDLGPSRAVGAQLTVTLPGSARPAGLLDWAIARDLQVRWRAGDQWAVVEGDPGDVAAAFDVPVHDYRAPKGQEFYASPEQPAVPTGLEQGVTALGRIMSYMPHRTKKPDILARDVQKG